MNNLSNYKLALTNNLKSIDEILAGIDRQIAAHRKAMAEHEDGVDILLKAKAAIRAHAATIQGDLVK